MSLSLDSLARFEISSPPWVMADLRRRLETYRPPSEPVGAGWRYGVDGAYLKDLIAYWHDGFDWPAAQARLNQHAHYRAALAPPDQATIHVHLVIASAARVDAPVLLMTPGWPSSLVEHHDLIARLSAPERHGGRAEDAVTVVAAELPGFGLSGRPERPLPARAMAGLWRDLMVDVLGVERFFVHGGDWGAVVGSWLALDHPQHVQGLHLSLLGLRPAIDRDAAPLTEEEKAWLAATKRSVEADNGYAAVQGTKPTTLAVGLSDSPAALAAWLIEKYHGWCGAGDDEPPPFDRDQLLTAATLYWALGDLSVANWIYWAERHHGGIGLKPGERVEVPTGLAQFGRGIFPIAPRSWAERAYQVVRYDTFERGGHFPGWLTPEPLAASLSAFIAGVGP